MIGAIRVHTVGIDRAVNAGFLGRLAALGAGRAELVESEDRLDEAMEQIHRRIGAPVVTGLSVTGDGFTPIDGTRTPARLPGLYPGVPLVVTGRYTGAPAGSLTVTGRNRDDQDFRTTVAVHHRSEPAVTSLWARARLRDLEDAYASGDQSLETDIVGTSLRFGVLCRFTAYVAVDERVVDEGGHTRRVTQPVELPSGWEMPVPPTPAPSFLAASSPFPGGAGAGPMIVPASMPAPGAPAPGSPPPGRPGFTPPRAKRAGSAEPSAAGAPAGRPAGGTPDATPFGWTGALPPASFDDAAAAGSAPSSAPHGEAPGAPAESGGVPDGAGPASAVTRGFTGPVGRSRSARAQGRWGARGSAPAGGLSVDELRELAAVEVARLREAAQQPALDRRDLLDDLASRLTVLLAPVTDPALDRVRELLGLLRDDTSLEERWAAALQILDEFALGTAEKAEKKRPFWKS